MNANISRPVSGNDDLVIEEFGQQMCANLLAPALPCWFAAQGQVSAVDAARLAA
ncbi:hypothetical protein [Streptomyces sp. NPDC050485]|uniref:hypothetical protein n=1 Tax=Streptomyces sp. NPDC050485 TaxID=3365617 RepID=UPI0037995116